MYLVSTIGPIIAILLVGHLLVRFQFADRSFFRTTNRLVYWVALPALLFVKTAPMRPDLGAAAAIFAVMLAGTLAALFTAFPTARALHLSPRAGASLIQGAFRGNLAYVGLPIVLFALAGKNGANTAADEATAILAFVPMIPLFNIAAVLVLVHGDHAHQGQTPDWRTIGFQLLTNPILVGVVAGLLYSATNWPVPALLARTLSALGQMALPLALISLGAALSAKALRGHFRPALCGAAIKTGLAPLIGALAALALGVTGDQRLACLLFLACPTAVASYVMADRLGGDTELAAAIVVLSTLLAMPGLALVLLFAG